MNFCRFFVLRPVSTIVLMLLIVLMGIISFKRIPVREYPDIETPVVSISTKYVGAAASIIETKITQVIENAVSGIDGIDTIQSTSKEGRSTVRLEFSATKNIDSAVNDVRDKISRSMSKLPDEADSPIIEKFDSDTMPIMTLIITSDSVSRIEITDYINRYLLDRFSIIDGVANASIIGAREKSIRIWLHKDAMAARKVTISDVENALKRENIEYPSGRIESRYMEYPVVIQRKYNNVSDFKNLMIRKNKAGDHIKLMDVADIEINSKELRSDLSYNGVPMVGISISKQSNSNTIQIADNVKKLIKQIEYSLPIGMSIKIAKDDSTFIKNSIREVYDTLWLAAILVFFIIYVFIGSVRATIIPAITIPISIIGSFSIVYILGYSINMLTLLAMVLAIGTVVDDSIVVLENIYRRVEDGEDLFTAAIEGSKQVVFAVISTTVVLLAVFLPICFWPGKTGKMFSEFAITISSAIIFSSIVALTLTPMLCSRILTPTKMESSKIVTYISCTMKIIANTYEKLLKALFSHKNVTILCFLFLSISAGILWHHMSSEYEPLEDRSQILIKTRAAEGIGFNKFLEYMKNVENTILSSKYDVIDGILNTVPGMNENSNGGAVNSGHLMLELKNDKKRMSAQTLASEYRKLLRNVVGIKSSVILPTGISSRGSAQVQFVVTGNEYNELKEWRDIILEKCANFRGLVDVDCDYQETTPQFFVDIDVKRASELNVSVQEIGSTLETMLGSKKVTTYVDSGREYDVILQAAQSDRKELSCIRNLYIRNNAENLVNMDSVISIFEKGTAQKLKRFNRNRAITISAGVGNGYSLNQAIAYLNSIVREYLPNHAQVFYSGQSKDFIESEGGIALVFFLAVIVSYLVLSSQFESFVSPIIVMLSVPLGAFGAIIGLKLAGFSLNIYNQIGLLMLIGLSAKQGILIVEFANQLIISGYGVVDAAICAAKLRLRPIIMTCLSTVVGAIPLVFATGASSISRRNIGIVEVCGCTSGVLFISVFIPILYILVNKMSLSNKNI